MSKNGKVIQRWNIVKSILCFLSPPNGSEKTFKNWPLGTACDKLGFPGVSDGKESAYIAGNQSLIPGLGKSPGERNGNPFQYSCWRIPRTEEPGGLLSMGSQRVRHNWTLALSIPYFSRGKLKAAHHIEISLVRMDEGCFTVFTPLLIHSLVSLLFCWSFPATCPVLPWGHFQPSGVIMCKD